ncbi:MAG: hypothetical protein KF898_03220 [Parachlamydiales bacterium]|nr:hypothetical protein [Candidatus Acheromyda pituitae]
MTTAVNSGNTPPTGGQMITPGGNNYGQLGAGPAGELATIMAQLLQMYEKNIEAWSQMSAAGAQVQGETANASAQAQIAGAQAQSDATKAQAWQAGISGVITVAQMGTEYGMTSSVNDNIETQQNELGELNNLNESVQNKLAGNGTDLELTQQGTHTPSEDPDVNARIQEMQTGRFQTKLQGPVDDQAAINAASKPQAQAIKDQLDTQISNKQQSINSLYSSRQQTINLIGQGFQIANSANGGIAQGVQASYQAEQGLDQAISTTTNTASQMAGTAENSSTSAMSKAQEEITSAIQQFRAGAQAYPQG